MEKTTESRVEEVQRQIDELSYEEKAVLSDGYHSFSELYEHRNSLFVALCENLCREKFFVFKSRRHSDGGGEDGWFLLCVVERESGEQISYHLPVRYWGKAKSVESFDISPVLFDGHSSKDVLERLLNLV